MCAARYEVWGTLDNTWSRSAPLCLLAHIPIDSKSGKFPSVKRTIELVDDTNATDIDGFSSMAAFHGSNHASAGTRFRWSCSLSLCYRWRKWTSMRDSSGTFF